MADYYPLIARAIAGLDPSAPGESRRALYERARTALIAQLRSVQPPLSESEITRERLSLEEAVRKVESEAAQRAREASRPAAAAVPRAAATLSAAPMPGRRNAAGPPGAPPGAPRPRPPSSTARARGASAAWPGRTAPAAQSARRCAAARRAAPAAAAGSDAGCRAAADPRALAAAPRRGPDNGGPPPQPPGMRGFRDIAADADDLGRAAAQANRAARKTYANVPSPSPEFDRLEPSMENRGADPDAPYSYDELVEEADRYAPQPSRRSRRAQRSRLSQDRDREPKKRARTGAVFPFKSAIAVGIVLILVGAGILWGKSAVTAVSGLFKSSPGGGSAEGSDRAAVAPEDPRSRRPAVVDARTSRRWRSASCCMTRIRPIPRASNMSAR